MVSYRPVKVVKLAEQRRPEQPATGQMNPELASRDEARALAARVKEWVSEVEQARPVRFQELRRQLGWWEIKGDSLPAQTVSNPLKSEK